MFEMISLADYDVAVSTWGACRKCGCYSQLTSTGCLREACMGPPPPPRLSFADAQSEREGLDQYIKDSWDEEFEQECGFLPIGSALTGRLKCAGCGTYALQGSNYCLSCQKVPPVGPPKIRGNYTNSGGPR